MPNVRTSIELPDLIRTRAGELARASDLNFQQWARRVLADAVSRSVVFTQPADLPLAAEPESYGSPDKGGAS